MKQLYALVDAEAGILIYIPFSKNSQQESSGDPLDELRPDGFRSQFRGNLSNRTCLSCSMNPIGKIYRSTVSILKLFFFGK
jgi:hypothetical protein